MSIEERFERFSQQKRTAATLKSQELTKKKEEAMKQNVLVRFNALRRGVVLDDSNFTPEELLLAETITDMSMLTVDDEGHLCLVEDFAKSNKDTKDALEEERNATPNTGAVDALRRARDTLSEPEEEPAEEEQAISEDPENAPELENVKLLRMELLNNDEAEVFIATAHNPLTKESAYAYCMERGQGEDKSRIVVSQCSRDSELTMLFYAMSGAIQQVVQPAMTMIKKVTFYMSAESADRVCRNSGSSIIADPSNFAVQQYRQQLSSCRDDYHVEVLVAPAKSHESLQMLADKVARDLIVAPV